MMLKWIGAALILFAGTVYGFMKAAAYAKRPMELRQLSRGLMTLETEIVYGVSPLPSALSRSADSLPASPVSDIFALASRSLSTGEMDSTASECWRAAVKHTWHRTSLKSPEKEALLALGPTLGVSDRDDQAKHIRLVISQLHAEEETAREEQARYEKMWKSLGALTAALFIILMY